MAIASKLAEVMNWTLRSGGHEPEKITEGEACVMDDCAGRGRRRQAAERRTLVRFFTVKTECNGRPYYVHVEATDNFEATRKAMANNSGALSAQVVREIDRAEFERLTGAMSPTTVDISNITEYGLTQKLSNSIRCF